MSLAFLLLDVKVETHSFWAEVHQSPARIMKTRKIWFVAFVSCSLVLNVWLTAKLFSTHINPRAGKDFSVEMRNMFDGSWEPVILVHGYSDNYSVAKYIVDLTESDESARGGRPPGSFRVIAH